MAAPRTASGVDSAALRSAAAALGLAAVGLISVSCASRVAPVPANLFSLRPLGQDFKGIEIRDQEGDGKFTSVGTDNFVEATVAQGSGRDGFDSVRILSSGSTEAVFGEYGENFRKVAFQLGPAELAGFFEALNRDGIHRIKGTYRADVNDGGQGFIEVVTTEGRRYCWFDNHFQPLKHTYKYCNRVIVPRFASASRVQGTVDPQAEYYRIFKPDAPRRR